MIKKMMVVKDIKYKSQIAQEKSRNTVKFRALKKILRPGKKLIIFKRVLRIAKIPLFHSKVFIDLELKEPLEVFEIDHHSSWG